MAFVVADRVKETSTTTGTGTLDLAGAATGFQTFVAGIGTTNTCPYVIEDANGTAWEVGIGTVTDATPDTLARTTLLASSTGSAINLSAGTHTVFCGWGAYLGLTSYHASRGFIEGMEVSFSSTTAITVSAGAISINNKVYRFASTTYTSGSTMKDMANSTVTIGASKCYFVFAYNNSGTLEIRIEERDGTGDGADPTWDTTLDYWKATSTGAEARRIGKFWTNGSSNVIKFYPMGSGRCRSFFVEQGALVLLNAGTQTSYTGITITPYYTADDRKMILGAINRVTSGTSTSTLLVYVDGAGTASAYSSYQGDISIYYGGTLPCVVPYTGSLGYKLSGVNQDAVVYGMGVEYLV